MSPRPGRLSPTILQPSEGGREPPGTAGEHLAELLLEVLALLGCDLETMVGVLESCKQEVFASLVFRLTLLAVAKLRFADQGQVAELPAKGVTLEPDGIQVVPRVVHAISLDLPAGNDRCVPYPSQCTRWGFVVVRLFCWRFHPTNSSPTSAGSP